MIPSSESGGEVVLSDADLAWIIKEHRYREIPTGRPVRIRKMTGFSGIAPHSTIGCYSSSRSNLRLAIMGRVLSKEVDGVRRPLLQTLPPPGYARPLLGYASLLTDLVPPTNPIALDEFPLLYQARKRKNYQKAAESLRHHPLSIKDAQTKLFQKYEKDVRSDKPGRIPRCILPPDQRFIVEVGRCVRPIEHRIYDAIDHIWGLKTVSKGRNYREVASMLKEAWDRFERPVSLDCDVSKMDQSFGEEIMRVVLDLIADCSSEGERFRRHLHWTLRTKVRGRSDDALFSYEQVGTLSSGMPFTSLAGVVVVTGILWLFKEHYGIVLYVVDAGDDMTIVCDAKDVRRVRELLAPWYKGFGLTLEVGPTNTTFEGIEFCQSHPCVVQGEYQMVRNARSAAVKDAVSLRRLDTPQQASAWLRACGQAGLASQGGVPIATARYHMMIRSADAIISGLIKTNRQRRRYDQLVERSVELGGSYEWFGARMNNGALITDAARVSFEKAFAIPPHVQRAIEDHYDGITLSNIIERDPQAQQMRQWDASDSWGSFGGG